MAECVSKDDHAKGAMCLSPAPPPPAPPSFPPWTFLELQGECEEQEGAAHGDVDPRLRAATGSGSGGLAAGVCSSPLSPCCQPQVLIDPARHSGLALLFNSWSKSGSCINPVEVSVAPCLTWAPHLLLSSHTLSPATFRSACSLSAGPEDAAASAGEALLPFLSWLPPADLEVRPALHPQSLTRL